ncbi:MAG: hypothetical protein QM346_20645 [Chloroflexota bacterium]|nr:hypothetical protein [Chloroflexota bacterium]
MNEENPRRWRLVGQGMGIPWEEGGGNQLSLDHLFLDQDGIPTLVEVKRSTVTRIRREVVGQMFEYAAYAVSYWPVENLRARFEARCQMTGAEPEEILASFLGSETDVRTDPEEYWQQVKTNLQAGRIRMLFVADEIPFQLHRIAEFLNKQMSETEVLAVEVKQYIGESLQTLVPRVIGQTTQTQQHKAAGKRDTRQWDEALFFKVLSSQASSAEVEIARRLLEWGKRHSLHIWWGSGARDGAFMPLLELGDRRHQLFCVFTYARVSVRFQYMKSRESLDDTQRLELLHRINNALETALPDTDADRLPSIKLTDLTRAGALEEFLE